MFYEEGLSAVRYAQKLALASGCLTQVSLSQAAGYQVHQAANCTSGGYSLAVPGADGAALANANIVQGLTITVSNFPVVFDSPWCPSRPVPPAPRWAVSASAWRRKQAWCRDNEDAGAMSRQRGMTWSSW